MASCRFAPVCGGNPDGKYVHMVTANIDIDIIYIYIVV